MAFFSSSLNKVLHSKNQTRILLSITKKHDGLKQTLVNCQEKSMQQCS